MRSRYAHWAVIVPLGRGDGEAAVCLRPGKGAGRCVSILPFKGRHEAHLVCAVAVIEPCCLDGFVLARKGTFEALFHKGVALFRAIYRDLQYIPALYQHRNSSIC